MKKLLFLCLTFVMVIGLIEAKAEQRDNARPELAAKVDNFKDYDVVFIGYPIWWGDMPMAVYTFLESYDFTGKKVIRFCTYDSSGICETFSSVASAVSGAETLDGFGISESKLSSVLGSPKEWLDGLNLK